MESLSPLVKKLIEAVAFGVAAVATSLASSVAGTESLDVSALVQVFLAASAGKYLGSQVVLK